MTRKNEWMEPMRRDTVLPVRPLARSGCGHDGKYFGRISPPERQRRMYANGNERGSLNVNDPPCQIPLVAMFSLVYFSLVKPYLRGLVSMKLNRHHFKYGWTDTNWRS